MIQALLSDIWPYVAGLVGLIVGFFYAQQSGKRQGRADAERKQANAASEQRRKINVVDSEMAKMDDDDVRRDLAKWVRPTDAEDR